MPFRRPRPAAAPEPGETLAEVLAEVRRIEVQSSRLVTDVLAGGYRSTFRGAGVEVADVREYVEGDDPRAVDWNVTARVGRPFVKRFVEERELSVVFVLDLSASLDAGIGAWSLRQLAARFCALLGLAAIANNDRIGLIAGSSQAERVVLPRARAPHVLRVVRDCLVLRGASPGGDLGALLERTVARVRRRTVVFVLSDFVQAGCDTALAVAGRRHDLVAVRLVPREAVAPPLALVRTRDPETGAEATIDFADPRVRAAWLQRCAAERERTDTLFRRARVDRIEITGPAEPDLAAVARPLLRFFQRRERREAKR